MSECTNIEIIYDNEYIGDSLPKINTNFQLLSGAACHLSQLLDTRVNVRTFFYYGPNQPNGATEFEEDEQELKPTPVTIQNFINSGLNLPLISEEGDIAWVIYQRTGWRNLSQEYERSGSGSIPFTRIEQETIQVPVPVYETISIGRKGRFLRYNYVPRIIFKPVTYSAPFSWNISVSDLFREYAPIFALYKLEYSSNSNTYSVLNGFPKYTRAVTASTNDWNKPELWNTY